ncbi:hypothetical protein [uncultured Cyclobacterium sp.]|uniref:hypothetical protein n=1 Tax=uncultured Cyclobacterium sp. TaxID=453820 RepID=UPI0030EB9E7B
MTTSRCLASMISSRSLEKARQSSQQFRVSLWQLFITGSGSLKRLTLQTGSASGFHPLPPPSYNNKGELMAAIQYPSGVRLELYSSFQNLGSSYIGLLKSLTESTRLTGR